jgi:small subunit ribosomal protein S18
MGWFLASIVLLSNFKLGAGKLPSLTFPPVIGSISGLENIHANGVVMNSGAVSKKKLFISNLDFEVTSDQLRALFDEVGPTLSVVVASDRETKRSKGFAFVEMESEDDAKKAIEGLNNRPLNGRPMKVCEDRGKNSGPSNGSSDGQEGGRKFEPLPSIQRTQLFKRRKKLDPFTEDPTKTIDYKDVGMLSKFVSERGRILSRRLTGLTAYNQRKVSKAIKRAQSLGMMAYTSIQSHK